MHSCLSGSECEVLRALVLGLQLRKIGDDWQFVGPWQDPTTSKVAANVMSALLEKGYVRTQRGKSEITEKGRAALAVAERELWERGPKWLRSLESRLNIC